jgi:hypothetical protein
MVTGAPEMCQPIIKNYLDGSLNGQQATKTAICLRILSSDAAVSDFLLPEIASEFLEGLNSADGGLSMEDLTKLVKLLEETAIELSEFLICFLDSEMLLDAIGFIVQLANISIAIAEQSIPPSPAVQIPNSYDPSSGMIIIGLPTS